MDHLFLFAAHNTVVALLLAAFVFGLTRVWRNPPVAHVLWLLVLLKLVAPPAMRVEWPAFPPDGSAGGGAAIGSEAPSVDGETTRFVRPTAAAAGMASDPPSAAANLQTPAATVQSPWNQVRPVLFWAWLAGATLCGLIAAARILRFERILQGALPASERTRRLALKIAAGMGVQRKFDLRLVACASVPLLWCAGRRPTIVLPRPLVDELDEQQMAWILAHELAHLRRRDHWVRVVELFVSMVYWWNPLVWVVRRQIHEAEDLCCDAWVRSTFPDCAGRYAELLFKAAEWLGASSSDIRLLPASAFLQSLSLKARIEMILQSQFRPRVSKRSVFAVTLLGLLVLPAFVVVTRTKASAAANDEPSGAACDTSFLAARFKYRVPFDIDSTQTKDGGRIEIREVWGTREQIEIGGQYLVRGKYVLPPGEHGKLYFYATAAGPWGLTSSLDLQSTPVDKQEGEFALIHGMAGPGDFHLILTAHDSYSRWFANVYFGNRKNADKPDDAAAKQAGNQDAAVRSSLTHCVKFEQGATQFASGDKIVIEEVRGTAATFTPGNVYRIKGRYTLASRDKASLDAYVTVDAKDGLDQTYRWLGIPNEELGRLGLPQFGFQFATRESTSSTKHQRTLVTRGDGAFELLLPMTYQGWPHVSFYSTENGQSFGGNYFGTGDSVLKQLK